MKIKSLELPGGVIVDFEDNGKIHLKNKYEHDGNVIKISPSQLETIRTTYRNNGKVESNGVEVVNKEKV